jgi:hypothetical protein
VGDIQIRFAWSARLYKPPAREWVGGRAGENIVLDSIIKSFVEMEEVATYA